MYSIIRQTRKILTRSRKICKNANYCCVFNQPGTRWFIYVYKCRSVGRQHIQLSTACISFAWYRFFIQSWGRMHNKFYFPHYSLVLSRLFFPQESPPHFVFKLSLYLKPCRLRCFLFFSPSTMEARWSYINTAAAAASAFESGLFLVVYKA